VTELLPENSSIHLPNFPGLRYFAALLHNSSRNKARRKQNFITGRLSCIIDGLGLWRTSVSQNAPVRTFTWTHSPTKVDL
jgi:hypothetical protein